MRDIFYTKKSKLLFDRYKDDLYKFIFYISKDKQFSTEILQYSFITTFHKFKNSKYEKERFHILLFRICINLLKQYPNLNTFTKGNDTSNVVYIFFEKNINTQKEILQNKDFKKYIKLKLNSLSISHKTIIFLYFYMHLSLNDISKILNTNTNAIKSKIIKIQNEFNLSIQNYPLNSKGADNFVK